MANRTLSGVRVLELSRMVAGPYCGRLLADLGAEVVKVEQPGTGDPVRHTAPFAGNIADPDRSILHLCVNTNKQSITLNMNDASGQKIFKNLIKDTDILIEDTDPGTMAQWGMDYEACRRINPALIMASITPFGQTGPYANRKSYPLNTFLSAWEGYLTPGGNPFPERPPTRQGTYVGEYEAAVIAAVAILAALFWRHASGKGQHIDCSKQEMLILLDNMELLRYPNDGLLTVRGTRGYNVGGVMPCKNGFVEFTMLEEHQWQALVRLMGEPEWTRDERFQERSSRENNGLEINKLVNEYLAQHTKDEIYHGGQAEGCTVAPYYRVDEVVASPQTKARGFVADMPEHPVVGRFTAPLAPYRTPAMPCKPDKPAPRIGEHNAEVFQTRLGMSAAEMASLKEGGVI